MSVVILAGAMKIKYAEIGLYYHHLPAWLQKYEKIVKETSKEKWQWPTTRRVSISTLYRLVSRTIWIFDNEQSGLKPCFNSS